MLHIELGEVEAFRKTDSGRLAFGETLKGGVCYSTCCMVECCSGRLKFYFSKLKTSLFSAWREIPMLILNLSSSNYEVNSVVVLLEKYK